MKTDVKISTQMDRCSCDHQRALKCLIILMEESDEEVMRKQLQNPSNPDISMRILHTVLHTFPMVLTQRICLTIKTFFTC